MYDSIDGVDIKMTEDHRISSASERNRFSEKGQPLKAGQTRLYGDIDYFLSLH